MILVNDKQVEFTKFPDGTTSFRYNPFGSMTRIFNITWKYDGDEECILLWYLVNHIRDHDRTFASACCSHTFQMPEWIE